MYLTKFYFQVIFFHIAFYHILKNGAIIINRGSFFEGKEYLQLYRFQFLKMNQLLSN